MMESRELVSGIPYHDGRQTALDAPSGPVSYDELAARAEAVAAALRAHAGPGDLVTVHGATREQFVLGTLAVLRAGAAWVPVDATLPAAAVERILSHCRPVAAVSAASRVAECPRGMPVVELERCPPAAAPAPPPVERAPDDPAYVIYTSGSTGEPKGVVTDYGPFLAFVRAARAAWSLDGRERVLQVAPPSFDVFIEDLFPTWAAEGALVLPRVEGPLSARQLDAELRDGRVTSVELSTRHWEMYVDWLDASGRVAPQGLRRVLIGGERVNPAAVVRWSRHRVPLWHVYGVTEATVTSTTGRIDGWQPLAPDDQPPLGDQLDGCSIAVLDRSGNPVPHGAQGVIYIGGERLARGYLHDQARTTAAFRSSDRGSGRFYRTGDIATLRADGSVVFVGRADHQVKVRGHRVELEEVEAALAAAPGVARAVAQVRARRLVAFLELRIGEPFDRAAVRRHLSDSLPPAKMPDRLVVLPALPLSRSGKVDRSAVSALEIPDAVESRAPATASTLEAVLVEVLRAKTGLGVAPQDDFKSVGLSSLDLLTFADALSERLRRPVPAAWMLEHASIAALAGRLTLEDTSVAAGVARRQRRPAIRTTRSRPGK